MSDKRNWEGDVAPGKSWLNELIDYEVDFTVKPVSALERAHRMGWRIVEGSQDATRTTPPRT
jgi:hypothetical protein